LVLEVDNIELSFNNKKILSGIYLKAETGKVTGILGRNGCGKSCLLEIIFGNLKSKYSNIRIDRKKNNKTLYSYNNVAYLPQYQLLLKALKLKTIFKLFDQEWEDFVLLFNHFEIYKNSKIEELSSGEVRIVETYLIVCSQKKIILLDEPFSFIAPIYVEKIRALIEEEKKKKIIIITDHFYNEILEMSDTLYLLKNGYSKQIKNRNDLLQEGYLLTNR
jgi:ABC-type multidrug transport system ATPase subunit